MRKDPKKLRQHSIFQPCAVEGRLESYGGAAANSWFKWGTAILGHCGLTVANRGGWPTQSELPRLNNFSCSLDYVLNVSDINKQEAEDSKADIGWGSQIRSYVLDDQRIKDLRTGVQSSNCDKVLDGDLDQFIVASLKQGL